MRNKIDLLISEATKSKEIEKLPIEKKNVIKRFI